MGSVTQYSIASTYTSVVSPSQNYSSAAYLRASRVLGGTNEYIIYQFQIPQAAQISTIKRATLYYTFYNPSNSYLKTTLIGATIFNEANIGAITYNNYNYYVATGALTEYTDNYYPQTGNTVYRDVTSLLTNNIHDNKFGVAVCMGQTGNDYVYITNGAYLVIEYEDIKPATPVISEPNEQYVNDTDPVTFRWIYSADSPFPQYSVTIEWRKQGESAYNVVTSVQSGNSYTFASGIFPPGSNEYRIKTIDTGGNSSDYAYAKFVVKSKPAVPVITSIDNSALTKIVWNSSEQVAYEMALYKGNTLIYSESVNSVNKEYKPSMFLDDGTYTFMIRVKNSFDLWSSYASKVFTISTTKPSKPLITVYVDKDKTNIKVSSSVTQNYVYRIANGKEICIGVTSGVITDNAPVPNTINQYFVRAYNVGYTDSDKVQSRPFCNGFVASDSKVSVNITKSLDKFMPFNESQSRLRKFNNYLGRKYLVRELSEFVSYSITRTSFVTQEELELLLALEQSDDVILYRDDRGRKVYCDLTLGTIKNEMIDTGYEVEVKIIKVDYEEGVAIND